METAKSRIFKCEHCNKVFKKQYNLNVHNKSLKHRALMNKDAINTEFINEFRDLSERFKQLTDKMNREPKVEPIKDEAPKYDLNQLTTMIVKKYAQLEPMADTQNLTILRNEYRLLGKKIQHLRGQEKNTGKQVKMTINELIQ
jgi:hypothetical protein